MNRNPFLLVVFLVLVTFFSGCDSEPKKIQVDPAFGAYISGYTSGVISKNDAIHIRLTSPVEKEIQIGEPVKETLFDFDPGIDGEAYWLDNKTIEFKPNEPLKPATIYTAEFFLSEIMQVDDKFETFTFQFQTIKQDFSIYVDGLVPYSDENLKQQYLEGRIVTADQVDTTLLQKVVLATQDGKSLPVKWIQNGHNEYLFKVQEITRSEDQSTVIITTNGDPIGVDRSDELKVEVPALGDFKVIQSRVIQSPEQYVEIRFSDPLIMQDLKGLITIEDAENVKYIIDKNSVKIYPSNRLAGYKKIYVSSGIKNSLNYKTQKTYSVSLQFEQIKPALRLVGDGVILPNSNGLVFPFEAVSLQYVDVYVKEIFENNVLQFLQENRLSGSYELRRVARTIKHKRINLSDFGMQDLHSWHRYHLDLSDILKTNPGAIYRIEVRFKKAYTLYACEGSEEKEEVNQLSYKTDEDWDGLPDFDDYDDHYYYYNWKERDDPCSDAYYAYENHTVVAKNIIASDLGMIAKIGGDRVVNVVVNNMITTDPVAGATVEFYDYQQQLITTTTTDGEGMVTLPLQRKPFIAVASHNNQKAYLKLQDGDVLSMSKFDVSGDRVERGIKGFLYGERGVWRPGDSLYLSFILEDKENVLPPNHPVTLELYNPKGKLVQRNVQVNAIDGFYDFRTATSSDDPTGYYQAIVKVGNRKFRKSLRIETVKPNRLKIYLDFGGETIYSSVANVKGKMNVKWLHGATAGNLKAKVDMTLSAGSTHFKNYSQYIFDDPAREFSAQTNTIFEGKLDENGDANINPNIQSAKTAPGKLRASFNTKVFEQGGNFSVDRYSIDYSPFSHYVGVNVPQGTLYGNALLTDVEHEINIQTLTEEGKVAPNRNVKVEVYKIEWRWWWDSYNDNIGNYISRSNIVPLKEADIQTNSEGKWTYNLMIKRPAWGRFLIRVTDKRSGHSTGKIVYIDWPYWARSNRRETTNANMLGFSADKETYEVDEDVTVTFPSSEEGRALVSIENGTKVLQKFWVETEEGETKFDFKATKEMAPNAYIHITLLQPHQTTANDHPIRMYGIIPLMVENKSTHLHPEIITPKVFRPETKATVEVKEKDGKPMTYTLAIVDEGLLDLTRFQTPEPWKHFYAREALGVKTWDIYDDVIGAYGGKLDKLMAIGGDGSNGKKNDRKANRFKPMVKFIGPFEYTGGTDKHEIDIPNYVGSVRVMVVAGKDLAYGHAEKAVPVRNPLMVLATLPRVLSPGETVDVPVNVFAMEKEVKNVTVSIQANEMFTLDGPATQQINFDKIGDKVINFKLKVKEETGFGSVKVFATSGTEKARDEIELNVRAPNPRVTDVIDTVIEAGQSLKLPITYNGIKGTNEIAVEFSNFPSLGLEQRLDYLISYPHGCIEQTTSSVFPQLYLNKLINLSSVRQSEIDQNIREGLNRLVNFQTADGGMAYWQGQTYSSEWGSNYAGHFILEAENNGYAIPIGLKNNWLRYQREKAREWSPSGNYTWSRRSQQLTQAYRLYTLALAGEPELGAMNRLRENRELTPVATWRLAAAYELAGQHEAAQKLITDLPTRVEEYTELSYTYGSNYRDEAMILETLTLMKRTNDANALMKEVAETLRSNRWMSTQTTAYSLLAVSKFLGKSSANSNMNFNYKWQKGQETVHGDYKVYTINGADDDLSRNGQVDVANNGQGKLFVRLTKSSIPLTDTRTAKEENLVFSVTYEDMNGNEIDVSRLPQGMDFIARVKINNPGARGEYKEMALNQLFPSGWEIINSRMEAGPSTLETDIPTYQDIRDDRVYTYFDLDTYKTKIFRIQLNATYLGKFYLPVVSCEAMYDNSINARTNGKWVEVIPQD